VGRADHLALVITIASTLTSGLLFMSFWSARQLRLLEKRAKTRLT
jgi:hypothetical protein